MRKFTNLIDRGLILGFTVKINPHRIGYTRHKIFLHFVNISKTSVAELVAYLKRLTNTTYISKPFGFADLEFELMVESNNEFHGTMRELRMRFPDLINNYSSIIISNEPYVNFLPERK